MCENSLIWPFIIGRANKNNGKEQTANKLQVNLPLQALQIARRKRSGMSDIEKPDDNKEGIMSKLLIHVH